MKRQKRENMALKNLKILGILRPGLLIGNMSIWPFFRRVEIINTGLYVFFPI